MENNIVLHSAIAEITPEDFAHPGLRLVRFVFCDDQPNENKQGVEYADFDEVKKSAVGTPIKMKFFGTSAGGHTGSIPIGYIKSMHETQSKGTNQLIADAILFADEYPDEIHYLFHSYAEGNAPGISFEMRYTDSILRDGVEWLKGLITRAATFVRHPAYGNRTAILALAANKEINEEQMMQGLSELINENSPNIANKGGNNRMEEDLKKLQEELDALKATIANKDTSLAERDAKISDLETKVSEFETKVTEDETKIADYEKNILVSDRTQQLVEAGVTLPTDADKLSAKQAFYVSLSEDAFKVYKEDLAEVISNAAKAKPKDALASLRQPERLPKFDASASADESLNLGDLRMKMRGLSRTSPSTQSE